MNKNDFYHYLKQMIKEANLLYFKHFFILILLYYNIDQRQIMILYYIPYTAVQKICNFSSDRLLCGFYHIINIPPHPPA